jgi:hypothetical protein
MFLGSFGPVAMLGSSQLTHVAISTVASLYDTTNGTTYTITGGFLGAADPDRWLAVVASSRGGSGALLTIDALTIGGTTYDYIDKADGINLPAVVALYHITTGTTADIVATWGGGNSEGIALQVYRFLSSAPDPRHVAALSATGTTSATGTLDVASGGAVVAATAVLSGLDPTWVGVTESGAIELAANPNWAAAARSDDLPAETGRTITASSTGGDSMQLMAVSVKPS